MREKSLRPIKKMMEFLFEFLVDGRNLAGKGLSFAEWLQAKRKEERKRLKKWRNTDLTNKDQTVQIVEAPKPPQPVKPEQRLKPATVVPMLPKQVNKQVVYLWFLISSISHCFRYNTL